MKALRFAVGLVFDDPWLFGGVLVSAAVAFLLTRFNLPVVAGIALLVGVLTSLCAAALRRGA